MVQRAEGVFRPADVMNFRRLADELKLQKGLVRIFNKARRKGATTSGAFRYAWVRVHQIDESVISVPGPDDFRDLFLQALTETDEYLEFLVAEFLNDERPALRSYNKSANQLDPVGLMIHWREMAERRHVLGHQGEFEARRNFAIASQILLFKLVDPDKSISKDVVMLEDLSQERLFADSSKTLYSVFRLNVLKHSRLIEEPRITANRAEAEAWAEELRAISASHQRVVIEKYTCRVIKDNGRLIYVELEDPRKRLYSRISKYERIGMTIKAGRRIVVKDARRGAYTEVAVEENGVLRIATRDDARHLFDYICAMMWEEEPLAITEIRLPEDSQGTLNRHDDYWDIKLYGRIRRTEPDGDRVTESFVEQQVTNLSDGINEKYATDNLNHGIRRGEQLMQIVGQYWPVDIFGVQWEDEDLRKKLTRYWKERFSL